MSALTLPIFTQLLVPRNLMPVENFPREPRLWYKELPSIEDRAKIRCKNRQGIQSMTMKKQVHQNSLPRQRNSNRALFHKIHVDCISLPICVHLGLGASPSRYASVKTR